MSLLSINTIVFCLLAEIAFGQNFLSHVDKETDYHGYDGCSGKIERWKSVSDHFRIRYETTKGDTLIFRFEFHDLLSVRSDYPQSDSQKGLQLRYYKNQILISYPSDWMSTSADLPTEFKLIDLDEKEGSSRMVRDHFFYDEFTITLDSKKYDSFLRDTVLHYAISGKKTIYHAALIQGFLFCRKYGFIRWDYGLETANGVSCVGYLVDKKKKRYLLTMLKTQEHGFTTGTRD